MTAAHVVPAEDAGMRLDAWLAGAAGISRTEAAKLIEEGLVTVAGAPGGKSQRVSGGETVQVERRQSAPVLRVAAGFRIVHEDADIAVVVKPPGVVTHPGAGTRDETLAEALARHMPLAPAAGETRAGIVHRLDRDTSGLLVVAKTDAAYAALRSALDERRVKRTYLALVAGDPGAETGRIEAPLGRSESRRTRRAVAPGGRVAITDFRVVRRLEAATLCEVQLATGRTHQIRVHFAHIGHAVVGDREYGPGTLELARRLGLRRPFLHACALEFQHPATGRTVAFADDLPPDLEAALAQAGAAPGEFRGWKPGPDPA